MNIPPPPSTNVPVTSLRRGGKFLPGYEKIAGTTVSFLSPSDKKYYLYYLQQLYDFEFLIMLERDLRGRNPLSYILNLLMIVCLFLHFVCFYA